MSFHGGLLGVLLAAWIFARQRGRHVVDVFDFAAPLPGVGPVLRAHRQFHQWRAVGTTDRCAVGDAGAGSERRCRRSRVIPRSCTRRCSKAWCCSRSCGASRSRPRPRFAPSALFLICYSVARILVEFVREPDVGIGYLAFGWLTMGQLLSLPMLLLGIGLWSLPIAGARLPVTSCRRNDTVPGAAARACASAACARRIAPAPARCRCSASSCASTWQPAFRWSPPRRSTCASVIYELLWFLRGDTNVALPARAWRDHLGRVGG